jgi:ribonucleotide reductase beta subunit family protein with ferritin-like domain
MASSLNSSDYTCITHYTSNDSSETSFQPANDSSETSFQPVSDLKTSSVLPVPLPLSSSSSSSIISSSSDENTSSLKKSTKFHIPHSSVANHYLRKNTTHSALGSRLASKSNLGSQDEDDIEAITGRISKDLNLLKLKLKEKKETTSGSQSTSTSTPDTTTSQTTVVSLINQLADITSKKKNTSNRYSFFPIKDEEAFAFYKSQEASVWSANEMDFIRDKKDYENLEPRLKHLVDMILGFFAPGDGLIAQNLVFRFLLECETFEEQAMFITQMFIELVHAETYGMTIMVFHPKEEDQKRIFSMCEELPCVKAKTDWMNKYMYADIPKSMRYLAFSACEGIFFSVLFSIIFWFRSKGILQNFIFSNEQISKDEGMHRDFGALLFRREIKKNPFDGWEAQADQILEEALTIELEFLKALVPEPIDDLSFESLSDYAKVVTDSLRVQLGLGQKYKIKNTLSWMNDISLTQKTNFYEGRVGNYQSFSKKEALNWKTRVGLEEKKVDVFDTPDQMDF